VVAASAIGEHGGVRCRDRRLAVRSKAATVFDYVDEQPDEWRPTLRKLRAACRRELRGYKEMMRYGMPSYARDEQVEVSFAKQARNLSLYILNQAVFEAHRPDLDGLSLGKGCIRFMRPAQLNWDVVSRLLSDTRDSTGDIC
jgi:uncharacterized protein YdhG (YjbR/CyaY superfamily)